MFFSGQNSNDTKLYDILNVSKNSSSSEIKKSYRKLAMKYHPDRNINNKESAEKKFKEISYAYDILSDPEKKSKYDQFGLEGIQSGGAGVNPFDIFNTMFGEQGGPGAGFFNMFGGGGGNSFPKRPSIRKEIINVDLDDVYNEKRLNIKLKQKKICKKCNGLGVNSKESIKKCHKCDGTGQIVKIVQIGPGMISQSTTICNYCKGEGKIINESDRCEKCLGSKYIKEDRKVTIELKNTMLDGAKIEFEREGDEDINTGKGHLLFVIRINKHKIFKRKGNDLIIEKKILLSEALSGGNIIIKHMDGRTLLVKLNKIIKPFSKYRIRGEGMNKHGDMVIIFNIIFPERLDDKRKLYLTKLLPLPDDLNLSKDYLVKNIEEVNDINTNKYLDEENDYVDFDTATDTDNVQCAQQ